MTEKINPQRVKTLDEIRAALSEDMDRLRAGETTPAVANASVNQVGAFLRTIKMEMDYARMVGRTPNIPMLLTGDEKP